MQDNKVWYTSKTLWLNVLGTLVTILTSVDIMPLIPQKYAGLVAGFVAVGNIILRSMKSQQNGGLTLTTPDPDVIKRTGLVLLLACGLTVGYGCAAVKAPVYANPSVEQVQATRDAALRAMNAIDTSLIVTQEVLSTADALQRANRLSADTLRGISAFSRDYARAAQVALRELKDVGSEPSRRQTLARLNVSAQPYIDKLAQSDNEGLRAFAVALRVVLGMSANQ